MRPRTLPLAACLLPLLLAACSKPAADTANATAAAGAGSVAPASTGIATPFDPLLKDEQRARNVQAIVNQQAAKQRAQIAAETH
ncbi:MAG: hypothetical protein ACYC97_03925 [Metallibacterium sp.]